MELSLTIGWERTTYNWLHLHFRYDSDKDGVVSVREVALVFRSMGYNPTEAELQVAKLRLNYI